LTVAHELYPAIYEHLVLMSLVCAWLTSHQTHSQFDVGQAAAADLLHNLGILHVDPALLQRESVLDRNQRRQLYAYPLVSAALWWRGIPGMAATWRAPSQSTTNASTARDTQGTCARPTSAAEIAPGLVSDLRLQAVWGQKIAVFDADFWL